MDDNKIIPYIEPIFHFCCKRLNNRHDAEDLTSEIICCVLEGMQKYQINSLDAWIWRIAHNRYARFIDMQNKSKTVLTDDETVLDILSDDCFAVDNEAVENEYENVFRYLHTLSKEYRDIFVDYYIGEMSIRALSQKYSLPETTIKWRLNIGRKKIKTRIGDNMERVYRRINWNTTRCNGNMDSDRYLNSQISRAICQAAYEKPLSVEEISIATGIPTMYIEDELPRLEYGDAICKIGNKYATNFIVFSLDNRKNTETASSLLVKSIADKFENLLRCRADAVNELEFFGHNFGMDRLGFTVIPKILRSKISTLKLTRINLNNGPYPPRKDGGYGWFTVEEAADENENVAEYNTGCNTAVDDSGRNGDLSHIYYYWIAKYFDNGVYHGKGTRWLCSNGILQNSKHGFVSKDKLSDEDAAALIKNNLITKADEGYMLNFSCFTQEQYNQFISLFAIEDEAFDDLLTEWIMTVKKSFKKLVPARLDSQINQWVSIYLFQIIGYVIDELIDRGVLRKPDIDKPLTDGVFCVEGNYINP